MNRFFTYILLASIVIACHIETPQRPVSRFKFTPENGCKAPCTITFISESENGENIWWDFGDGSELKPGDSVSHRFEAAKSYEVKLIVKGVDGGSSGFTQIVNIEAPSPDAFSISGDQNFPTDIVADAKGNVYVSGTGSGEINFGIGFTRTLSNGADDFFVAKYNSEGQCQWVYTGGSSGNDHANALALDSANHVYLTGFVGDALLGGSTSAKGNLDGFVAMLDANSGAPLWFKTFGGPLNDQGRSLAFYQAAEGPKLYLTGTVEGDGQNQNIEFDNHRKLADERDGFLVIMDVSAAQGTFGDPALITGRNIQAPEAIAVDKSGDAYITGAFLRTIKFPSTALEGVDSVDVFVAKWKRAGPTFQWARRAASSGVDFAYDILVDEASENVYVTGMHSGNLGELKLNSSDNENVFLANWNADGEVRNNARNGFNEKNPDYHGGIALTPNGEIVIAGSFSDKGWFPMKGNPTLKSKGGTDIIITKVDPESLNPTIDSPISDGGTDEDRVNKICTINGYVYATGWFYESSTFNGVRLTGRNYPMRNTFIARYRL
ncbi:PKD domain-containing protein [Dyadobacter sp.]|uniref:PKD domain-containing protein n=1 Tax=Dyadobacter sp. TaxID=1914288 RepID=UPI0025BA2E93|nr:PKD domain-containing protein [Dyadobacter sp.]